MHRTVVIADVQGNGVALDAAVEEATAEGFDRLVLLGDLLTYGCEPERIVSRLHALAADPRVLLIVGNHDQMYFDLRGPDPGAYFERLPEWIRETVEWTADRIDLDAFAALPWVESARIHGVLYDHANPYPYGDWTYLNGDAAEAAAATSLAAAGLSVGVFGHTHRAVAVRYVDGVRVQREQAPDIRMRHPEGVAIVNPGSVGQPRSADHTSSYAVIHRGADHVELEVRPLEYDVEHALACIDAAGFNPTTVERLAGYLGRSAPQIS